MLKQNIITLVVIILVLILASRSKSVTTEPFISGIYQSNLERAREIMSDRAKGPDGKEYLEAQLSAIKNRSNSLEQKYKEGNVSTASYQDRKEYYSAVEKLIMDLASSMGAGSSSDITDPNEDSRRMKEIEAKKREKELDQTVEPVDQDRNLARLKKLLMDHEERLSKLESSVAGDLGKKTKKREPTPTASWKTTSSGLQYYDSVIGSGASPSSTDDSVTVNYLLKLDNSQGKEIDSSYKRGRSEVFPLKSIIPGFTEGIMGMRIGGQRKLIIPPVLGYKDRLMGSIPPNSTLYAEIELLDINQPSPSRKRSR